MIGHWEAGTEVVIHEDVEDPNRVAYPHEDEPWWYNWRWYFGIHWDCRFCPPDYDYAVLGLSNGANHAQFEEAMKDIAKASSCAAFEKLTNVVITDVPAAIKNSIDQPTTAAGEVTIELDGVTKESLTQECHTVIENAFATAYADVYGADSMIGHWEAGTEVVIHEDVEDPNRVAYPHEDEPWWYNWRWYFGIHWDCRFCPPDYDYAVLGLSNGANHAQFEEAMKDIAKASSCVAFEKLTKVTITDAPTADVKMMKPTGGEVTIELDHIFVGELSETCQAVVGDSFVNALHKIFHTNDKMKLDIVAMDKKRIGVRLGDWSYTYNLRTFWDCQSCDINAYMPSMLDNSRRSAFEQEFLAQLSTSAGCTAFQTVNGVSVTDMPVMTGAKVE